MITKAPTFYTCTKHRFKAKSKAALQLHANGHFGCEFGTITPQPAPFPARRPDSEATPHTFEFRDADPRDQHYGRIEFIIRHGEGNGSHRVQISLADLGRLLYAALAERRRQQRRRSGA